MATVSMKCPNCGGELIFDPKSQKYKCEYCGSDFALDEISTEEAATQAVSDVVQEREDTSDNHTQQRTAGAEDAAVLYTCPSCGAQIVTIRRQQQHFVITVTIRYCSQNNYQEHFIRIRSFHLRLTGNRQRNISLILYRKRNLCRMHFFRKIRLKN